MPFSSALKNFYENGFFELTHTQIFFESIYRLQRRIQHLKEDKPEIRNYQIYLNNIAIIPGTLSQERHEQVVIGRLAEHQSHAWKEGFTDIALAQMASTSELNMPLHFIDHEEAREIQLAELKEALVSLFTQPDTWNSMILEHIFFHKNHQIDYVATKNFYNDLLNSLALNESLKELTIKPFSLSKHQKGLVNFLTQNTELEFLHLQIIEANRQDWLELCKVLSMHPKLQSFQLDNSILDADAYAVLACLLDENYRIEISLSEPAECGLLEAYEFLQQRFSKSGLERFKKDHLAQDKLLQVAISALEFIQKFKSTEQVKKQALFERQFDFLVANEGHLAITHHQKEIWVKKANVLPLIYQNHKEYLKSESSLIQLQMNEFVADGSKTIGYVLMEKALKTQNCVALEILLNANVNLFEFPNDGEEPFLVKVLQSKGDLKRSVIEYIQHDRYLTELASEYLITYPELIGLFKGFNDHLDDYGAHFVKKNNPSTLLLMSKKILNTWRRILDLDNPSGTRSKEYAEIYLALDKNLQLIDHAPEEISNSFDEVYKIMIKMKEDSMKTLWNFFNASILHEKILELIHKFEMQLLDTKQVVVHGALKHKDEEIKNQNETIKLLYKNIERERAEANEKLAKMEAKQIEMEAKQARLEFEKAEMKETFNSILKQMTFNASEGTSASQDEIKTETRRFFRP